MRDTAFVVVAVVALVAQPIQAAELWRHGDARLELSGSIREVALTTRQTDPDAFAVAALAESCGVLVPLADCSAFDRVNERRVWQSTTRLRTRFDLQLSSRLSLVAAYDHEVEAATFRSLEAGIVEAFGSDSFLAAEGQILERGSLSWRHLLYRGTVEYRGERLEVVVGRQRVAWGVGRLWNPIDRFNATPPLAVEADESVGVDAALIRFHLDGFRFAEAVYAPGRRREELRAALRVHGVWLDSDWSLVAGVFERARTFGLDFARNLGDAALRIEALYADPERKHRPIGAPAAREPDPFWQWVVSVDWNADIGSGVYLLVEYFYNGNALGFGRGRAGVLLPFFEATHTLPGFAPASSALFGGSRVVSGSRHQTGLQLGYDLTPEIRLDLLSIYDWSGKSAVFFPSLRYSPAGSVELRLGVQAAAGPRRSQYGSTPMLVFLLGEWFF